MIAEFIIYASGGNPPSQWDAPVTQGEALVFLAAFSFLLFLMDLISGGRK